MICDFCKRDMTTVNGCHRHVIVYADGSKHTAIPWSNESRWPTPDERKPCHDCGAKPLHYHHGNCDVAEDPRTGRQLLTSEYETREIKRSDTVYDNGR